eukprot:COSAG01_NODE_69159_length_262_cov_0.631902_1_plen_48_part_10
MAAVQGVRALVTYIHTYIHTAVHAYIIHTYNIHTHIVIQTYITYIQHT